jgi:Skp family chaperone for outer membrane proteins
VILTVAAAFVPAAASAQAPAPAATAPRAASAASHTAVIDVGYIFKNHARFKAAMEKMKEEVLAAENALRAERDRINNLMEELKGLNVGSPDFKKREAELAKAQGDFNVNAQLQKKDFMDREARPSRSSPGSTRSRSCIASTAIRSTRRPTATGSSARSRSRSSTTIRSSTSRPTSCGC